MAEIKTIAQQKKGIVMEEELKITPWEVTGTAGIDYLKLTIHQYNESEKYELSKINIGIKYILQQGNVFKVSLISKSSIQTTHLFKTSSSFLRIKLFK